MSNKARLTLKTNNEWFLNTDDKFNIKYFGNNHIINNFEEKVFEQGVKTSKMPNLKYLGYTPDAHVGKGTCVGTIAVWPAKEAMISPSIVGADIGCGMRVILTPINADELDFPKLRRLMEAIEENIPTGAGKNGIYNISDSLYESILAGDFTELIDIYGYEEDLLAYEITGRKSEAKYLSERAYNRGRKQLGTLGDGNHFIEIQKVKVNDPVIAEKWGLFNNQIIIMIHSGSRGLGHQTGEDHTIKLQKHFKTWRIPLEDPDLVYAPMDDALGQDYYKAMNAALNFAIANRQVMTFGIRNALEKVCKVSEAKLLYDITHNYASFEVFGEEGKVLIHRKGSTRAFPKEHYALKETPWYETGHPVLIPGSMGTSSYILVGKEEGKKSYYTVCHGAGRVMSRTQARKTLSSEDVLNAMGQILINERNIDRVKDEAPQAYKPIDEIIDSVHGAGLADVVVQCIPIGVIKGSQEKRWR